MVVGAGAVDDDTLASKARMSTAPVAEKMLLRCASAAECCIVAVDLCQMIRAQHPGKDKLSDSDVGFH